MDMVDNNRIAEIKEKIIGMYKSVLKIDSVRENDDFFELGGDSYKTTILLLKLKKEFNINIPHGELFFSSTVNKLTEAVISSTFGETDVIEKVESKEYYVISEPQEAIFILEEQFGQIGLTYNIPGIVEIKGEVDFKRLENAFIKIIERHETLRTSFKLEKGEPVQYISNTIPFKLEYLESDENSIDKLFNEFLKPFDLKMAPLFRALYVKTGSTKSFLFIDTHHIISDGVSIGILITEIAAFYEGKELPPLKIQYKDFSSWRKNKPDKDKIKEQEEFWLRMFEDGVPTLDMPTDFVRPGIKSYEGERLDFEIGEELSVRIKKLAAETKATLYMILTAAYHILLSKYTGQEDILAGTLTSGRGNDETENMIGMFVNTLVLRSNPSGSKAFIEYLGEIKTSVLNTFENQEYQFQQLINKLGIIREANRNPMFDVAFVTQNMGNELIEIPGLVFNSFKYFGQGSKFDLLFETSEKDERIILTVEYCTKLFRRETITRMVSQYTNILEQITRTPKIALSNLDILTCVDKKQLLESFNATEVAYPSYKTINELFEEQVEKTPENTALLFNNVAMTYRELNDRANSLAHVLRTKGAKADDIIGIMITRSFEMLIGIIAVLKAGAAYLPVDPEYPDERINYMLEDSGTKLLLTSKNMEERLNFNGEVIEVTLEEPKEENCKNLEKINNSDNLAYVIYTSGSTGKPKGVMLEHKAVHNFIKGMTEKINFQTGKSILALTTICFDIFVLESLLPLTTGMKVAIADEIQQRDSRQLNRVIQENKIDMLQATPSRMQLIMSSSDCKETLEGISEIMIGGEALPPNLLQDLKRVYDGRIFNMYGPTETTVWSCVKELTGENVITIGYPIANTQIYIIDKYNNLQPIGVPGELCIAGDGLARGYYNKVDLTNEKFVKNPFNPQKRMYRTGDLVRWLQNGEVEYLGRLDHQVKIRGFRIELGEIQTRLLSIDGVKEAVVIDRTDSGGTKYLCAYISAAMQINANELKNNLSKDLPEYMIPSYFMQLEKLPLTPNGKIDRKSLPEPNKAACSESIAAPENELQNKIMTVWKKVLEKSNFGIDHDFFLLGGHSLLAIKLEVEMENEGMQIEYIDLYKYRTIRDLSNYLSGRQK